VNLSCWEPGFQVSIYLGSGYRTIHGSSYLKLCWTATCNMIVTHDESAVVGLVQTY